jgi:hypothetical protein
MLGHAVEIPLCLSCIIPAAWNAVTQRDYILYIDTGQPKQTLVGLRTVDTTRMELSSVIEWIVLLMMRYIEIGTNL